MTDSCKYLNLYILPDSKKQINRDCFWRFRSSISIAMTRLCGKKRRVGRLRRPTLLQYLDDDSSLRGGTTKQSTFLSSTHYAQKIWVNPQNDNELSMQKLLVGAGLVALPPTQPLPTASSYLTHCHSERNEMKR